MVDHGSFDGIRSGLRCFGLLGRRSVLSSSPPPPAEHLASHLSEPYEAIVIATVSELETVGSDDVPWWRATFEVERPVKGEPQKRVFISGQIGGGGVYWRVPTPAIGERWVVFLTHATDVDGFAYPQALLPEEIWNGRSGSRD